jgi:hypothetical protein
MSAGTHPQPDEPNPVLTPEQQAAAVRRLEAKLLRAMRNQQQKATELHAASEDLERVAGNVLKALARATKLTKYPRRDARMRQAGD